jgi:hydrogenase-4 component B
MSPLLPIDTLLIAACAWLAIGLAGLVAPRNMRFVSKTLFPLGALVGVLVGLVALGSLGGPAQTAVLAIGLPDLPFHLRLDNLSAVFALLLGFVSVGISIFAAGYFRKGEGTAPGLMCLQYHFFLASMLMVLLADDAYAFMVAWETMALSSFFLVTTDHRHEEIRRAGFLYLLIAHIGAIAILLCFGVMTGGAATTALPACARRSCRRSGRPPPSCWRWPASAPRPAWFRCMSGCRRRTRRRHRRCRR